MDLPYSKRETVGRICWHFLPSADITRWMHDATDMELLRQYADRNSGTAFAALVSRHVNLVYSAALRKTGNSHAAEEITQVVFIILAQKAGRISDKTILPGWLYQTARLTAANFLKREIRRARREQEAYMQTELHTTAPDEAWGHLAPLLEDAMGQLGEKDRAAVVLRFFGGKSFAEVAMASGVSENAAKKRVNHGLEKLHRYFSKLGVRSTTAIIAGSISANSVQAAPVALAKSVTAAAMTKGATVGGSTLALVKGTMIKMTCLKLKFAAGVGVAVLLAGSAATVAISHSSGNNKLTPQQIAKQAQDAYAALSSYSDSGTAVGEGAGPTTTTTFNIRLQRPNLYRIDWTNTGGLYIGTGVVWSDGSGDFLVTGAAGQEKSEQPVKMHDMQFALGAAAAVSDTAASTIPAAFFKQGWGDVLELSASGRFKIKRENDTKIGGVDCYVVSSVIDPANLPSQGKLPNNTGKAGTLTTTLWIGKRDHLIHQARTTMEGASITPPYESDSAIRTILERQNKPATPEAIAALRTELETSMKQAQGARVVFTQTHENISVNAKFPPSDFNR